MIVERCTPTLAVHIPIMGRWCHPGTTGTLGSMGQAKDAVGAYGERVAVRYLIDQGMVLLGRNWRCPAGELDAIFRDAGDVLVFVEVKTRRGDGFGAPVEAVGAAKVARLRRLAAIWLDQAGIHPGEVRFDVVSVRPRRSGPAAVEHLRGAF